MSSRNRRGNRQAGMKARLGIATAVLVGGGAVGVAAIAASHSPATTTAQSAAFTLNFHHTISEQQALSSALSTWGSSQQQSMTTLAQMAPMRTFSQFWSHRTEFAAQRGVVVLATKKFLLVRSADKQLHLWWLNGATKVKDVSESGTGMVAMTGNNMAAHTATATATRQPVFTAAKGVARGDLVFVIGVRTHGFLVAKLVLFAAPATATATPAPTPTVSVSGTPAVMGTHS